MGITTALVLTGIALAVTGAALIYPPAAFLLAGGALVALAYVGVEVSE